MSHTASPVKPWHTLSSYLTLNANAEMAKAFFKQPVHFFHDHSFITDVLDDNHDIPPIGNTIRTCI